jgi:hypothetical protein
MFETEITHRGLRLMLSDMGIEILNALEFTPELLSYQIHPWNKDATFDALRAEIAKRNLL